ARLRHDADPSVRAHAALSLADDAESKRAVDELLGQSGDAGCEARLALLEAIADHPDPRWADVVLEIARAWDEDDDVAARVARAMTGITDARFVAWLVPRVAHREGRAVVREALVRQGDAGLDALARALEDPSTDAKLRLHLPRTISRFSSQRAADLLLDALASDMPGLVRYKALRGLGRLAGERGVTLDRARVHREVRKNLVEVLRIAALDVALAGITEETASSVPLVRGLLGDKRRQALERAFRLLQIAHRGEDIRRVFDVVTTGDRRLRAQALEFLDALTRVTPRERRKEPALAAVRDDVRELVRLVVDDLPDKERVARASRFLAQPPSAPGDAIALLLEDGDDTLATLAAFYALEVGTPELRERVSLTLVKRPTLQVATPLGPAFGPPSARAVSVAGGAHA
ncbi:MAG TPA: hypothetical protein VHB21_18275, partial [Minicystis sp.]|nr:hypothetical protein [Minicystis sp.]